MQVFGSCNDFGLLADRCADVDGYAAVFSGLRTQFESCFSCLFLHIFTLCLNGISDSTTNMMCTRRRTSHGDVSAAAFQSILASRHTRRPVVAKWAG